MNIKPSNLAPQRPLAYENTDGRPSWSPDGTKVCAELGRDVVVLSREDHSVLNKIGPEGQWVASPDWSPDGSRILYSTYGRHRDYDVRSWGIYSSNPDGSDPKNLAVDGWEAEWNPQGDKIAYQLKKFYTKDRIAVMDGDGQNMHPVTKGGTLQRDFSWSPGGHQVTYDTIQVDTYQIRITDITGKKDRKITDGDSGRFIDKNPEWSPDGKQILFERHDKRFPVNGLWTVDPNTKKVKEVAQGFTRNLDATWSPDGSKIAFASNRDGGDLDIYVMDADGTDVTQVTDLPGHEHAPSWSPDGNALAFNRIDFEAPKGQQHSVHIQELS
jgi:Tol biopolymer transport system component